MNAGTIEHAQQLLAAFAALFVAGTLAAKLADRIAVPDVVLFLLIGIVAGPVGLDVVKLPSESTANQVMLVLGATFLLFQGGRETRFAVLSEVWISLGLLATVAVLVTMAVVAIAAHAAFGIDWLSAMLLGAVIASTDPATLVPIFLRVRVKERVAQTVLSESALNDATGAICTFAVLGALQTGHFSLAESLVQFLRLAFGGLVVGAAFGLVAVFLKSDRAGHFFSAYSKVLLLPVILGAYLVGEALGTSGFMAVFAVGVVYGNREALGMTMKHEHHESLSEFIEDGSLFLRMVIFVLLGSHLDPETMRAVLLPGSFVVLVLMFVARPLAVMASTLPDRRARWNRNEVLFLFWTRETGAIPAALSGMLAGLGVVQAKLIAAVTLLTILITLLLQATTTRWLAAKLGLLEETT